MVSILKPDETRLMRPLAALIDVEDPTLPLIREWAASLGDAVILVLDEDVREKVLLRLQVTTRSVLGAVGDETGGILVDAGRIRVLGGASAQCWRSTRQSMASEMWCSSPITCSAEPSH